MQEWFSKKLVIITSLFLIIIMGIGVWYLSKRVEENRYIQFSDTLRNYFRNKLDSQKSQALSLAIALAENKALKEALWDDEEDSGYEILSKTLIRLREYTLIRDVRAQVITTDLTIFARSWDNTYAGMPLDIFREDLKEITTLKKPKVAIEPGRLLSIKATTPIMQGAKAIGYLEILQFFDKITDDLRQKHIELLVLMNEKLLDIATLMRENPTVQNFVVSNKNYNVNLLKIVNSIDIQKLLQQRYLYSNGYFFIVEDMLDGKGNQIGLFLMVLSKTDLNELIYGNKPLSFFLNFTQKDLYQIVSRWEAPTGGYRSIYDKNLFKLLNTFEGEDRMLVKQEIYEVLQEYTKKELIDIILYQNRRRKITGVIE